MRKEKPQRETAPKPNFGQGRKKNAVNNIWGPFGKVLITLGHFLLRWEISEAQIFFLDRPEFFSHESSASLRLEKPPKTLQTAHQNKLAFRTTEDMWERTVYRTPVVLKK